MFRSLGRKEAGGRSGGAEVREHPVEGPAGSGELGSGPRREVRAVQEGMRSDLGNILPLDWGADP